MTNEDLIRIRSWFAGYCRTFDSAGEEERKNLLLKEEHTHQVCANAIRIGEEEGLSGGDLSLAEAAALLHDVGRFEQYRQYRTFRDGISVDHGAFGVEILLDSDILAGFDPRDRRIVLACVGSHNCFRLRKRITGEVLAFLRLVRDADKLDIWRIFADYYRKPADERSPAIGQDLPDRVRCSLHICEKVMRREPVRLSCARTLNDFKLVQLSWVFDLAYPSSFRLLRERGSIDGIAAALPAGQAVAAAVDEVRKFAGERASGNFPEVPGFGN